MKSHSPKKPTTPFPYAYDMFGNRQHGSQSDILGPGLKKKFLDAFGLNDPNNRGEAERLIFRIVACVDKFQHFDIQMNRQPDVRKGKKKLKKVRKLLDDLCSEVNDLDGWVLARIIRQLNLHTTLESDTSANTGEMCVEALNRLQRAVRRIEENIEMRPGPKVDSAVDILIRDIAEIWEDFTDTPFNHTVNRPNGSVNLTPSQFAEMFVECPNMGRTKAKIRTAMRAVVGRDPQ